MSKRTVSLIIALFVVTIVLLAVALSNSSKPQTQLGQNPSPTSYMQTTLSFSPQTITIPAGSSAPQAVNVIMQTGANNVTGVQLEMSYDPQALSNVSVTQGTMFQNPLQFNNKVDVKTGRISYVYAITPSQSAQKGSGTVAVITFIPNRSAIATTIKFLPKTQVTARGVDQSVLLPASLANMVNITWGGTTAQTQTNGMMMHTTTTPVHY